MSTTKEPTSKKLCQVIIELILIDKYGNRRAPVVVNGNSWTKQAAQNVLLLHRGGDVTSVRDTSNTLRTIDFILTPRFDFKNIAAATDFGVVIGTGSTAENRDDFQVETIINEGAGAGQMNYSADTIIAPAAITNGFRDVHERTMTNNSGGTINVTETCVICRTEDFVGSSRKFLILRDVITSFPVADTESLLVRYNFDFKIA